MFSHFNPVQRLAPLHKTNTIDGNLAINSNYHGNKASQPISIKDSMDVIFGKLICNRALASFLYIQYIMICHIDICAFCGLSDIQISKAM